METRLRAIAEVEAIHRNAAGEILSIERQVKPVIITFDKDGVPVIEEEK